MNNINLKWPLFVARSFIIIPYEGAASMQCARDVEQAVVRDVMLRRQRAILAPRHRQRLLFHAMLWRMMNDVRMRNHFSKNRI
jgi:hypothetical protein